MFALGFVQGPGAADDAIGVGIMLEILRIKIARKGVFENAVIFLFNDAEECFQGVLNHISSSFRWLHLHSSGFWKDQEEEWTR